jgi:predicted small secreted protein
MKTTTQLIAAAMAALLLCACGNTRSDCGKGISQAECADNQGHIGVAFEQWMERESK